MTRQLIIIGGVLFSLFAIGAGGLFAYNYFTTDIPPVPVSQVAPSSKPDNMILAGPVQKSTATSITITKQDGVVVTIGITASTQLFFSGNGSSTRNAKVGDLVVGKMVLITPMTSDASVAQSIIIVVPPPTTVPNQ